MFRPISRNVQSIGDVASSTEPGVKQKPSLLGCADLADASTRDRTMHQVRRSILRQLIRRMAEMHASVAASAKAAKGQMKHDQHANRTASAEKELGADR